MMKKIVSSILLYALLVTTVSAGAPKPIPSKQTQRPGVTQNATSTTTSANRSGKQAKLRTLAKDQKISSADRGWIKQEQNAIDRGKRKTIRNPPGKDLAHARGQEAAKGYSYEHSTLKPTDMHKLQHKYDRNGKLNKERSAAKSN